jgi:hypothetical protein
MQEERIKEDILLVKIPSVFEEEDRGFRECCEPEMVLASQVSNDSWKNDITPAWLKLYNASDTGAFVLKKDGVDAIYQPTLMTFPNDEFSIYVEVYWKDVLASDGPGCYSIEREYSISGVNGSDTWGNYKLLPFSTQIALGTARLRAVFNHFQEIEDINFKGANVNGTFRFYGKINDRQSNKEIRTLTYANREIKNVVKENIYSYEMKTDPLKEQKLSMLSDLYLLSDVQLFASDYNAHSNSYKILDIPVYLKESEEIEYPELSRNASMKAKLWHGVRNKRTYYI